MAVRKRLPRTERFKVEIPTRPAAPDDQIHPTPTVLRAKVVRRSLDAEWQLLALKFAHPLTQSKKERELKMSVAAPGN